MMCLNAMDALSRKVFLNEFFSNDKGMLKIILKEYYITFRHLHVRQIKHFLLLHGNLIGILLVNIQTTSQCQT